LLETVLKTDRSKMLIACTINLLAVSTVFMTQSVFLELSESFKIDITQARFSFSIASLLISLLIMSVIALKERG
jgi:YNFM family putative membrane transporter